MLAPLPLVFPTFIGAAAFIRTLNPGGLLNRSLDAFGIDFTFQLRGFFGAWLVLTLFTYPYVYLPVAARLRHLPGSLEETARVLGNSPLDVFTRVCLPQIAGSIAAGTLLVFLYAVSDFGAVQLMAYDTLTRAVHSSHLSSPAVALALSLLLLATAGVVVAVERALSARLPADSGAPAGVCVVYPLGRWQLPCQGVVWTTGLVAIGAPVASLADWAVGGLLRSARGGRPLTIGFADVAGAAWNTTLGAALAALLSAVAVLPIALLVVRHRSRLGRLAHVVVISTFAVPGILIALALRFWTLRSDIADDLLAGTLALLVLAYVVRFASLAMGVTLLAVRAVPQSVRDSARLLGASAPRRFATIELPLLAPGIAAGAGLVLLSVMKELPISLLVAPLGFPTLTTRIYGAFTDAFVAEAGILSLVLLLASFALSWLLFLRAGAQRTHAGRN
ncbi:MAG TPA: iron ABC transporter permease [Acidimicrobiaceae bacterium]|nr:iron ABC transporter permease [Acidimicrobiaceae bacterium]